MVPIWKRQIASDKDAVENDPAAEWLWILSPEPQGEDAFSTSLSIYWHKTFKGLRGWYGNQAPSLSQAVAQSSAAHVKTLSFSSFLFI